LIEIGMKFDGCDDDAVTSGDVYRLHQFLARAPSSQNFS